VTVSDYTISGLTAQVIRIGASTVVFVNGSGSVVVGTMTDATHAFVPGWNNLIATFGNGQVVWSNGSIWNFTSTQAPQYTAAAYTNAANGLTCYVIQINASTALFINGAGGVALGTMAGASQATVAPWRNDLAAFSSGKVKWSDGTVWVV
jgi:hypothetical protein